jgi:hypothetical protein
VNIKDMTHLPDDLWQLPDLRELELNMCPNLEHIPDNIPADAKIESLSLHGGKISLPSSLCGLGNLTSLFFLCRSTDALPDDFLRLTSLRRLSFHKGARLPPSMEGLIKLEEVHLGYLNDINTGSAFSQPMPAMRRLDIDSVANVHTIDMSGLTGLTELSIELMEHQSQLHPSIGSLSSLQRLTIGICGGLMALPAEIGQLTNLTALHLGDFFDPRGEFTIPEAISGLVRLRELRVTSSATHMPQPMKLPTSLTTLHMGGAVKLPASLSTLSRLHTLEFTLPESALDTLPALRNMPSVRHLKVSICNAVTDQRVGKMLAYANLTFLHVLRRRQDNNMGPVHAALPTLINLRELRLLVNCSALEPEPVEPLTPALDLPSSISNLSRLTSLCLCTPCNSIPPGVFLLTSLHALGIYCTCGLPCAKKKKPTRLSSAVSKLVNLRTLDLRNDVTLCDAVTSLPELTSVSVQWDGDFQHQRAVKALLARGVDT